jgi:hypothetical protein
LHVPTGSRTNEPGMNPQTLIQTIDALHAMKDIPKEVIFRAL